MGTDLHPSILKFFHRRMSEHDQVADLSRIERQDEYLFELRRPRFRSSITVWLSDAYLFTETDFYSRPQEIGRGDYIIVGKPEGGFNLDYELIRREQIGVGKIGKFMGALNMAEPWSFLDAQEREDLGIRSLL